MVLPGLLIVLVTCIIGYGFYIDSTSKTAEIDSASIAIVEPEIPERSIAVLPFEDMSVNRDQGSFTEAVVVEINNHLVKIEDLLVTSRASTLAYKNTSKSTKLIAGELAVATLLMGNVQREGDIVRVTAQLIDGRTDHFLWSETYETELASVFAIQSEIAHEVAQELKIQISPELDKRINRPPTHNMEAYDLYLEVKSNKNGPAHNLELLREAIKLDPEFADAYVEMTLQNFFYMTMNKLTKQEIADYFTECKTLLERAIDLDPNHAGAHRLMAGFYLWQEYDFEKADLYYEKAKNINPSGAMSMYPFYLLPAGRFQEALEYNTFKLLPSNPNSAGFWLVQALCNYYLGDEEKLESALQNAFEKDSVEVSKHHGYFMISCYRKDYNTIVSNFEKFSDEDRVLPRHLGMAAIAYLNMAGDEKAVELLSELKSRQKASVNGSPSYFIAAVYAERQEYTLALEWLNRSYNDREIELIWLNVDPLWNSIRHMDEFDAIQDKIGFITDQNL